MVNSFGFIFITSTTLLLISLLQTYTKLNKDVPVRLDILEKICTHFNIPIEQVIEIK